MPLGCLIVPGTQLRRATAALGVLEEVSGLDGCFPPSGGTAEGGAAMRGGPPRESSQEKAPLSFGGENQLAIHFPGVWWGLAGETLSQAWPWSLSLVP